MIVHKGSRNFPQKICQSLAETQRRVIILYLVRNDWSLVDDDVKESEDVSPITKVKKERGVTMNEAAFRQDLDLKLVDDRRDLKIH